MSNTVQAEDAGLSDSDLSYPLNPDSGHAREAVAAGRRVSFYLVDVTGIDADRLDALLATMLTVMRERELVPVFVTDLAEFGVLLRHGVIFETLPPLADSARVAPALDWRARRSECMALIEAKWQPVGSTTLGRGWAG